jgi:DNA polymerase elongation subunit (family B)
MAQQAFVNGFVVGDRVALLYRDTTGRLMQRSRPAEYCLFHPLDVCERIGKPDFMRMVREDGRIAEVTQQGQHWRVRVRSWRDRKELCKLYRESGVPTYEGDVDPVRRLLTDADIAIATPRRAYLDIETDSRRTFREAVELGLARVLFWTLIGEDGTEERGLLNLDDDRDEQRVLGQLWGALEKYDQVCAWNGAGFDFPVVAQRSELLEVMPKDLRRWLWLDHMVAFERMNKNAAESGAEKQSMSLQSVSTSLGLSGKHEFDAAHTWEEWAKGGAARERLVEYNAHDTRLMAQIEAKTGYLALFQEVCGVCGVFPDTRGLLPTQQIDGYMLRLGAERDHHFATKYYDRDDEDAEQYLGAYVVQPQARGVVRDVHVADFAAMYPSIIVSWNMSPETKLGVLGPHESMPKSACVAPTTRVMFSTQQQGVLALAVMTLLKQRDYWKKEQAKYAPGTTAAIDAGRKSMAYKGVINSFYGVQGSRYSRFYDQEVAESITQTGVWLLKHTIAQAESREWGMKVLAGDTDACMMAGVPVERFKQFIAWLNQDFYPRIMEQTGAPSAWRPVRIDYEKQFARLVFGVDDKGAPKKKTYVGVYSHYKGKPADELSKPEVKGLEWRRGDWCAFARVLQYEVIQLFAKDVVAPAEYVRVVLAARDRALTAVLPIEDVQLSKSLSKPLDEYATKTKLDGTAAAGQPHVALARRMREQGLEVRQGTRIAYYVVDGATEGGLKCGLASEYVGQLDRYYLWERLVYPPTMRLCMAIHPTIDWRVYLKVRPKKERAAKSASSRAAVTLTDDSVADVHYIKQAIPPRVRAAGGVVVVRLGSFTPEVLGALHDVLVRFPGKTPVMVGGNGCDMYPLEGVLVGVQPALLLAVRRFEEQHCGRGNMGAGGKCHDRSDADAGTGEAGNEAGAGG